MSSKGKILERKRSKSRLRTKLSEFQYFKNLLEEIEELFEQDVNKAASSVDDLVDKTKVDPKAYNLMVEMAFQMGGEGLKKFEKTIASVNAGEYEEAANHMLWNYNDDGSVKGKTNWYNQTETRAKELSDLMAEI